MGIFGSKDDHHETPCKKGGFGWPQNQKNPMGWGKDKPRPLKGGGRVGRQRSYDVASPKMGLIKQSGKRVKVTGEKPGKRGPK